MSHKVKISVAIEVFGEEGTMRNISTYKTKFTSPENQTSESRVASHRAGSNTVNKLKFGEMNGSCKEPVYSYILKY
jgi:hypothetical protein